MTPADAPHTVVRGLSDDEMRSALTALVRSDYNRLNHTIARAVEREREVALAA
jgi:hypothetical protein